MSLVTNTLKKGMVYPIEFFDRNKNKLYQENSNGFWYKCKFDSDNNVISYENSDRIKIEKESVTSHYDMVDPFDMMIDALLKIKDK